MYDLYQLPEGEVEPTDTYSLDATLKELKEETDLKIHSSKAKWISYDNKFNCDIYAIELDLDEKSEWTEQNKIGLWEIIS